MKIRTTLVLICCAAALSAQILPTTANLLSPPSTQHVLQADGPTGFFSGPLTDVLDQTFDSIAMLMTSKGTSAAMQLPDGSVWKRATGISAIGEPLTTDHLVGMGSMTKTFIATTLLLLQEEGALDLDDSIGNWIASHPNIDGKIKVRQLLNHTSGLYNYTNSGPWNDALSADLDKVWEPEDMLNYVEAPSFAPGTSWEYSNTNYILAGLIIEAITEQPLQDVLRERLLMPLGLAHTFLYPQETPTDDVAHLWIDITGDNVVDDFQSYGLTLKAIFSSAWAAGALLSTPEDISIFQKKLLNGEVLSSASLAEMQTWVFPNISDQYGLGLYPVSLCDGPGWGHDGYIFYGSVGFYFPELQMGLVVQTNDARRKPEISVSIINMFNALAIAYCNYQTTAAPEPGMTAAFRVMPNPVSETMTLQLDTENHPAEPLTWRLRDALGRTAKTGTFRDDLMVPMPDLPTGIYWLEVQSSGRTWAAQKVVKE